MNMNKNSKIYVAGHRGLVGSAIVRALEKEGFDNLILKTHSELDLLDQKEVNSFFEKEKPEYVFLAAAKVGGIMANKTYPAQFIYENVVIESNVINSAYLHKVKKLFFLGSSCIYPRLASQPMTEDELLGGKLEPTNQAYAIAKITGIVMCQSYNTEYGTNFISVMPTNIYGPNDNFEIETAHALPAFIARLHKAKKEGTPSVTVWGTGSAMREWLYVDDLAEACLFLMNNYDSSEIINIGTGKDISIMDLVHLIKKIVGFKGEILWDNTKPDGMPRKLLNVSKLSRLGWRYKVELEEGATMTYEWYKKKYG